MAPQKMVNSDAPGVRTSSRYARTRRGRSVRENRHRAAAITIRPIARPSRPSVKFTAFELPTNTRHQEYEKEGRSQRIGERVSEQGIYHKIGRNCLKNGTFIVVEYAPYACTPEAGSAHHKRDQQFRANFRRAVKTQVALCG